jgi:hypothetical protein
MSGDRPDLSSERATHRDNTATFRQKIIFDHKFQSGLDTKTVSRNMALTLTCIELHNTTTVLPTEPRYVDRIVREAFETEPYPNDMNWESRFSLSQSWKPFIFSLKDGRLVQPLQFMLCVTRYLETCPGLYPLTCQEVNPPPL